MPANFENGVFVRQPAWHGAGTVVEADALTWAEVKVHVPQLTQNVTGRQLVWLDENGIGHIVPDSVANIRSDGTYLGIVGTGYEAVQPDDAFGFMELLLQSGECIVHTAGSLNHGRKIWVQCLSPEPVLFHGEETERHRGFLTFVNSYDGSTPVGVVSGMTRVVCENTYRAAIDGADSSYWFKHTQNVLTKVEEARIALKVGREYWTQVQRIGEAAMMVPFSDMQFLSVLDHVIPIDGTMSDRSRNNADKERMTLAKIFRESEDLANVRGTAWAAVNAFTEFTGHHINSRSTSQNSWQQNRFNRIMFGESAADVALPIIYEMAGIK